MGYIYLVIYKQKQVNNIHVGKYTIFLWTLREKNEPKFRSIYTPEV